MNWKKIAPLMIICLIMAVILSGCAQSDQVQGTSGASGVAGFWPGLWHGFILPVSFIASLFNNDIGIYEIHNNGNWYNFGFVLGVWIIYGAILAPKANPARGPKRER